MSDPQDDANFLHELVRADSAEQLDENIREKEREGFELVTVVFDGEAWVAFMKFSLIENSHKILHELDVLNVGIGSLINNEPNFATTGDAEELKSVLYSILEVLENR